MTNTTNKKSSDVNQLKFRVSGDLRKHLEEAARAGSRSLQQEIEMRLRHSLERPTNPNDAEGDTIARVLQAVAITAIKDHLDRGRPNVYPLIEIGGAIEWPDDPLSLSVWLHRDALLRRVAEIAR